MSMSRTRSSYELKSVTGTRWGFWKWMNIMDKSSPTEVYLKRLRVIETPYFGIYLHWIYLPDGDRGPHDHPWHFTSFIVKGGYYELVQTNPMRTRMVDVGQRTNRWNRFSWHQMPLSSAHRITQVDPGTISLIVRGKRKQVWGFYLREDDSVRWVPWEEYDAESALEVE